MDLTAFFSPQELVAWAAERATSHGLFFTGLVLNLIFLVALPLTRGHLVVRRWAESAAAWIYRRPSLIWLGQKLPVLGRVRLILEKLGRGSFRNLDPAAPPPVWAETQWLTDAFVPVLLLLVWALLALPFDFYADFVREHARGLSTSTPGLWWLDWAKALGLGCLFYAFLGMGLFGLARKLPRTWWLWLWGAVVGTLAVWAMLSPYRAQIYSNFRPLPAGELRDGIAAILRKANLTLQTVEVEDTSRRTRRVNAYLMGEGPTKRVVLSDNLVAGFSPREITAAIAHEATHEQQAHPLRTFWATAAGALVFLAICRLVLWRAGRLRRLGLDRPADPAVLPVLLLVLQLLMLLDRPLSNWLSREEELAADRGALQLTGDPTAFASLMIRLNRINQADPDPPAWDRWFFCNHPPTADRLALTFEWAKRHRIRLGPDALPLLAPAVPAPSLLPP